LRRASNVFAVYFAPQIQFAPAKVSGEAARVVRLLPVA
jgi:hypothetical protein